MAWLIEHIERWFSHTTNLFALPKITIPTAAIDDDTTEWWSDIEYMSALADEIFKVAKETAGAASILAPYEERAA